jgi:rsbT co-antagonist protein RsbR
VLKENAAHNRSGLPPFRLPQVAQQLIAGLFTFYAGGDEAEVQALGAGLGHQGLGLRSLPAGVDAVVRLHDFMTLLVNAVAAKEMQEVSRQRDEMQAALERAVRSREDELLRVIQELSTPIMPLHSQILVLPLVGGIDGVRAHKINERLLEEVTARRTLIVILDVMGVPSIDAALAAALLRTAGAVQLLGARLVLVGIRPELALVLTQLGVEIEGLVTLADLQSGVEWALGQLGLAVQRQAPRG